MSSSQNAERPRMGAAPANWGNNTLPRGSHGAHVDIRIEHQVIPVLRELHLETAHFTLSDGLHEVSVPRLIAAGYNHSQLRRLGAYIAMMKKEREKHDKR